MRGNAHTPDSQPPNVRTSVPPPMQLAVSRGPWLKLPSGRYINLRYALSVESARDDNPTSFCVIRWSVPLLDGDLIPVYETTYPGADADAIRAWLDAETRP